MPYTPSNLVKQQRRLAESLAAPRKTNNDLAGGLAAALRGLGAYQGHMQANRAEAENARLGSDDKSLMAELLANPEGQAAPDFSSMPISQGIDPNIVSGAQQEAVGLPSMSNAEFATPDGQNMQLSYLLADKSRKDSMDAAKAKEEREYQNKVRFEKQKQSMQPTSYQFQDYNYMGEDGLGRTQSVAFDKNTGAIKPIDSASLGIPAPGQQSSPLGGDVYSDPKIAEAKASQSAAKKSMSSMLKMVANDFRSLYNMGGSVSNDQDFVTNLKNGVLGMDTINDIQERFGPDVASGLRQKIFQARPLLIGKIIQASDMSAKALDSNRELDFYLSALGDPGKNIQSQMAAVIKLNDLMGTGEQIPWAEGVASTTRQMEKEYERQAAKDQASLEFTARRNGMSVEEVKSFLSEQLMDRWNTQIQGEF